MPVRHDPPATAACLIATHLPPPAGIPRVDLQRADAVRDVLVARGVPASLIWIKPLHATEPLPPGATAEQGD